VERSRKLIEFYTSEGMREERLMEEATLKVLEKIFE
jgi:hypothetical protein